MSSPDLDLRWPLDEQERLFDADPFYEPAADPNQPWNLAPGLADELASDDDVHTWALSGRGDGDGSSGLGVAS